MKVVQININHNNNNNNNNNNNKLYKITRNKIILDL